MSWYLANESKIIDQFASGQGLSDLRREIEAQNLPALQDFIDKGVTTEILLCIDQLNQLVLRIHDEDVKITAQGLVELMRGQKLVVITQGFDYEDEIADEKLDPPENSNPVKPTKPTVRKARKKASAKT